MCTKRLINHFIDYDTMLYLTRLNIELDETKRDNNAKLPLEYVLYRDCKLPACIDDVNLSCSFVMNDEDKSIKVVHKNSGLIVMFGELINGDPDLEKEPVYDIATLVINEKIRNWKQYSDIVYDLDSFGENLNDFWSVYAFFYRMIGGYSILFENNTFGGTFTWDFNLDWIEPMSNSLNRYIEIEHDMERDTLIFRYEPAFLDFAWIQLFSDSELNIYHSITMLAIPRNKYTSLPEPNPEYSGINIKHALSMIAYNFINKKAPTLPSP